MAIQDPAPAAKLQSSQFSKAENYEQVLDMVHNEVRLFKDVKFDNQQHEIDFLRGQLLKIGAYCGSALDRFKTKTADGITGGRD